MGNRRLRRSQRDRIFLGVAGGLGEALALDPVIFRLLFVLSAFAGGIGLVLYLALAIVLPNHDAESGASSAEIDCLADTSGSLRTGMAAGLVLVGLGLLFLARELGWLTWLHWGTLWPVLLIALGLALLLRGPSRK